jgi:hypothetical protein
MASEPLAGHLEHLALALDDPSPAVLFVFPKNLDNLKLVLFEFRYKVRG